MFKHVLIHHASYRTPRQRFVRWFLVSLHLILVEMMLPRHQEESDEDRPKWKDSRNRMRTLESTQLMEKQASSELGEK